MTLTKVERGISVNHDYEDMAREDTSVNILPGYARGLLPNISSNIPNFFDTI